MAPGITRIAVPHPERVVSAAPNGVWPGQKPWPVPHMSTPTTPATRDVPSPSVDSIIASWTDKPFVQAPPTASESIARRTMNGVK
jgi:hypothetical protein